MRRRLYLGVPLLLLTGMVVGLFIYYLQMAIPGLIVGPKRAWSSTLGFWPVMLTPFLIALVTSAVLILEALLLGWKKSSLKRLLTSESATVRTDLFYIFLVVSQLRELFAIALNIGIVQILYSYCAHRFSFGLLSNMSFVPCFIILFLSNTLLAYITHWLMHSRALWEIHKIHHSAPEFNVITTQRNHPVDHVIVLLVSAVPAALLGVPIHAQIAYSTFNAIYQQLIHSGLMTNWGWVGKYFLLSPLEHRVHHSTNPEHYGKNLGVLVFWDYLFGTLLRHDGKEVTIGLVNEPDCNTGNPLREIWVIYKKWIGGVLDLSKVRASTFRT